MWDPSFMLKSYGVVVGGGGWWVAYSILVSAPVPFGFRSYWDLVGVGTRGFWLDNVIRVNLLPGYNSIPGTQWKPAF